MTNRAFTPPQYDRRLRALLLLFAAALAAFLAAALASGAAPSSDWTTYGASSSRAGDAPSAPDRATLKARWILALPGAMTVQPLVLHDVPLPGETTVYAATSTGTLVALAPNGFVRWQVELGQLANPCPQLDGFGITGTPVADRATGTLYVADAFGRLHGLALATGAERPGWPVRLYPDFEKELVWGALTLLNGAVYVPTGSYCDLPMEGKVIRVDTTTRAVSTWISVSADEGGGGGIWGWGGLAYSQRLGSLFAATGNAFEGGTNTGKGFSEAAGYGEQIVRLSPALDVLGSIHPNPYSATPDDDLVGSPLVVERPGCGELVTVMSKSATLYGWRSEALTDPPLFALRVAKPDPTNPVVSQAAWDATTNTVAITASGRIVGVRIGESCKPRIAFSHQFGPHRLVGSPTVSHGIAWLTDAPHAADYLVGIDLLDGKQRYRARLGEHVLAAPTLAGGAVYAAGFTGILFGFGPPQRQPALPQRPPAADPVARHTSWFGPRYGWRSVQGGVLATEDKGKTWHPIFRLPADRILRASRLMGVLTTGSVPRTCVCAPRVLWTGDAGKHWHATGAISGSYAGGRTGLYWWTGADVSQVTPWPAQTGPLEAHAVFHSETGRIAAGAFADGVFYGVLGDHRGGKGWDVDPKLIRIEDGKATTIELPETKGLVLVQSIAVSGKELEIRGHDYGFANAERPVVVWRSLDGGSNWALARQPA